MWNASQLDKKKFAFAAKKESTWCLNNCVMAKHFQLKIAFFVKENKKISEHKLLHLAVNQIEIASEKPFILCSIVSKWQ